MNVDLNSYLQQATTLVRPYLPHLLSAGVCIIVGLGVGALRVSGTAGVTAQSEKWVLPQITRQSIEVGPVEDLVAGFWTEQPRPSKKKAEAVAKQAAPWRFIGTVDQGSARLAVIELNGSKVQRLKFGDTLPDGSKILEISESELSFERAGDTQRIRLFMEKKP